MSYMGTGYFSHDLIDGKKLVDRAHEVGIYSQVGEIMYRGDCDLRKAVEAWKESPAHNKILNDSEYNQMVMIMYPEGNKCVIIGTFAK